ncbi:HXXEE domain-containing protein [Clostridium sp. SHJSY1]|uniref:HXXEE domain-containing protein n=1 Tax=Clostridium sp. SHJSY1 TaxID=2942483 RepID=UPI002874F919|nr:HXXEE domain-containing protein [Clostridium sp. SHJSY1]MDS0524331.1 HXXEE domain-containing protein [Clostridium sp. SHJSY1]
MNEINVIVWLLPILFILHDFEEIIMIKAWRKRYKNYLDTCKMRKKPYQDFQSTAEFSIGVEIIFVIFLIITVFTVIFNNYYVWYGFLFTFTAHFIVAHFNLCYRFKHYVPGVVTSILFLPLTIYLLFKATILLKFNLYQIIVSCIFTGIIGYLIVIFLKSIEKYFEKLLIKFANK